jgi:hypothetical protein
MVSMQGACQRFYTRRFIPLAVYDLFGGNMSVKESDNFIAKQFIVAGHNRLIQTIASFSHELRDYGPELSLPFVSFVLSTLDAAGVLTHLTECPRALRVRAFRETCDVSLERTSKHLSRRS